MRGDNEDQREKRQHGQEGRVVHRETDGREPGRVSIYRDMWTGGHSCMRTLREAPSAAPSIQSKMAESLRLLWT